MVAEATGALPILARVEKRAFGRRLAWSTAIFCVCGSARMVI